MKKLVMGANGFLGSHVTRQLIARGDDVRVMVREGSNTANIEGLAVETCYGDIFDEESVAACLLYTSPSPRDLYRSRMPSSA